MRKSKLFSVYLFTGLLSLTLLAGCQNQNVADATKSESEAEKEETQVDNAVSVKEPEITDNSATEKSVVFYNKNGEKLAGKIYVPDGDGKYPVVIMVAGWGAQSSYFKNLATELASNGVVGVCYDPIGYCYPTKSDGNGDRTLVTLSGGASDLEDIIVALGNQPFIDKEQVYLLGHSMGGLITFYSAVEYQEKIAGYIGIEPSFQTHEQFSALYPDESQIGDTVSSPTYLGGQLVKEILAFNPYDKMESFNKPVLFIAGTGKDSMGGSSPEILENAKDLLPQSELTFIEGANHTFDTKRSEMVQAVVDYMVKKCTSNP